MPGRAKHDPPRPPGYWDDVEIIGRRALKGRQCYTAALAQAGNQFRLVHTRRRARPGWAAFVQDVKATYPTVDIALFWRHLTPPIWLAVLGDDWSQAAKIGKPLSTAERFEMYVQAVRHFIDRVGDRDPACVLPGRASKHPLGRKLTHAIDSAHRRGDLDSSLANVIAAATERSYDELLRSNHSATGRVHAKTRYPANHDRQRAGVSARLVGHRGLRSESEVAVDVLLAAIVGDGWPAMHTHDLKLCKLVPHDSSSKELDLVVWSSDETFVVMVGASALALKDDYVEGRAYKKRMLEQSGIAYVECDLHGGERTIRPLRETAHAIMRFLGRRWTSSVKRIFEAALISDEVTRVSYVGPDDHRKFIHKHGCHTVDTYEVARQTALDAGLPSARYLRPRGSLQAWLRELKIDWFDLTGKPPTGKGSQKARRRRPEFQPYDSYRVCKLAAQVAAEAEGWLTCLDYKRGRAAVDPKLVAEPDKVWPRAFKRDGWPGFLGVGTPNSELLGLVPSDSARKVLGIWHSRWKVLIEGLEPDGLRRRRGMGDVLYFAPHALVRYLTESGELEIGEARTVLARLKRVSRNTLTGR